VRKVFEAETLDLDFGPDWVSESKSPARAGLAFFSDLSLSVLSMNSTT